MPKKVENRGAHLRKDYVPTGEPKKVYVPTGLPRGRPPLPDHLKKTKKVYVPKAQRPKGPYVPTGKPRGRPKKTK